MGQQVKVILQPVKFRKRNHIAILSPNNAEVDEVIREFQDAEWSTGYRFWHIPLKTNTIKQLTNSLKGIASVNASSFENFNYDVIAESTPKRKRVKTEKPSKEQQLKLKKFINSYLTKGYSQGTLKVYLSMLNVFFGWHKTKLDTEINSTDISDFIYHYVEHNKLSPNYKRLMINSLKRYFEFIGRPELNNF